MKFKDFIYFPESKLKTKSLKERRGLYENSK